MYLQKRLLSWTAACAATLVVSSLLLSACCTKAVLTTTAPTNRQHYLAALADAQRPDQSKVSNDLMPISDDNKALEWTTVGDRKMVLVCKMIDQQTVPLFARPDTFRISTRSGYWVSLPADWARRADQFEGLDSVAARRRMVEMLGLWPECDYDMVATFYVDVTRLFRPAYDPSINTTTSPADFPAWVDDSYTVGGGVNFRKWFADQQSSAYKGRKACPWAQLGYSYDWHSEAPRQGISEYIATDKSVVLTKKVQGVWSFVKELRKR